MKTFQKILVANRGEIAVRVIRAAQQNGIRSVAVYAADDAGSMHVLLADEAVLLSGTTLAETYLNQDEIIRIALKAGAGAIHPGYGFLSENAGFAKKIADAGLVFIGPSPENIRVMGEKNQALAYVRSLGVPVLPSFRGTVDELLRHASEMDFPVLVKASGGGGGKGMVICNSAGELPAALEKAERQALNYFGNGELFVEKYLPRARHIEVQLMGDHYGNVLHFFERECTVQRRFQKIMEEAPSPSVNKELRSQLTSAALEIARSMNYRNAGTIEFLLDEDGHFYFLEMNTRIQVEHPVTEMITNTDLVSLQLQVAAGNELSLKQEDIRISGSAAEVRLCAEDAENNFKPSAGELILWQIPEEDHLRIETFAKEGSFVSPGYDSLLAKLVVWSETRSETLDRMSRVLSQTAVSGVHTNLSFLSGLLESDPVRKNEIYTRYVDENLESINQAIQQKKDQVSRHKLGIAYLIFHFFRHQNSGSSVWNQIGFWRIFPQIEVSVEGNAEVYRIESSNEDKQFIVGQEKYRVSQVQKNGNLLELKINRQSDFFCCVEGKTETLVSYGGFSFTLRSNMLINQILPVRKNGGSEKIFQNLICADLFGKVLKLNIKVGEFVQTGQILLTLESMKTEIHVISPADARVKKMHIKEGDAVVERQLLVELEEMSRQPTVAG